METNVRSSKWGTLQFRDVVRGVIVASLTSGLVVVQQLLEDGSKPFNWTSIGMSAIGGGVAYVLKNWLLEPSKVITVTKTKKVDEVTQNIKEAV